jgi:hypothetical protein
MLTEPEHPRRRRALGWGEVPLKLDRQYGREYVARSNPPSLNANWRDAPHGTGDRHEFLKTLLGMPPRIRRWYIDAYVRVRREHAARGGK